LRRLRLDDATREIPVIAVSANAMPGDIEHGLAAGFVEYLTKPLDMQRLIAAVEHALAAR
jgi:CheY-like chemotaxis protein